MNIIIYIEILTVLMQCFTIALLRYTMKTPLTYLHTTNYVSPTNSPKRITKKKRLGCLKTRAPPINKRVNARILEI